MALQRLNRTNSTVTLNQGISAVVVAVKVAYATGKPTASFMPTSPSRFGRQDHGDRLVDHHDPKHDPKKRLWLERSPSRLERGCATLHVAA